MLMREIADRVTPVSLPDLAGRRAVVTGASAGIGSATATALAGAGAEVVLAVRNRGRGETAAAEIRRRHPEADVSVELIELSSMRSIGEAADRLGVRPVHLLINNAGLGGGDPQAVTEDGFDLQVGVNYLGAWALTAHLWQALRDAGDGRVVMLGSTTAGRGRIGEDFGHSTGSAYQSYCDSKLATVVFAEELRRRAAAAGSDVVAVAAHPGWCATAIFDTAGPPAFVNWIGRLTGSIQSPHDGAQPVLMAATVPNPEPYYGPTRHRGFAGPPGPAALPQGATEPGIGARLWQRTTEITGISLVP